MIILHMLNNLHKHGIFSRSSEHYKLLLQQNKILVKEIKEMKSQIDIDSYTAANNLYRKIIKEVNIRLFRILLKEQYSGYQEHGLDLDFLYDYDDNNIRNARFFRQIIFNRKIRNIIKHAVLKKFFKQRDDPDELFRILIDLLEKLDLSVTNPAKEAQRCIVIEGLLAKKKEFIDRAKGLLIGGGDELKGGYDEYSDELEDGYGEDELRGEDGYSEDGLGEDGLDEHRLRGEELVDELKENELIGGANARTISLNGIFTFIALEFNNQQITDLCQKCIVLVDKDEAERINYEIDKTLKDTTIDDDKKSIYFVHIVDPSKVNKNDIIQSIAALYETDINKRKTDLLNAVIHSNSPDLTRVLGDIICEAGALANTERLEDLITRTNLQNILDMLNTGVPNSRNLTRNPLTFLGKFITKVVVRQKIYRCLHQFHISRNTPSVHEYVESGQVFFRIIFGVYIENTLGDRKIRKIDNNTANLINVNPDIKEIISLYALSQDINAINAFPLVNYNDITIPLPPDCINGRRNPVSYVYVASAESLPLPDACFGEIGHYVAGRPIKFVKVIINNYPDDMEFVDKDCPTDSSRPSTTVSMVGGAYYKKYLKYKNKYVLTKNI